MASGSLWKAQIIRIGIQCIYLQYFFIISPNLLNQQFKAASKIEVLLAYYKKNFFLTIRELYSCWLKSFDISDAFIYPFARTACQTSAAFQPFSIALVCIHNYINNDRWRALPTTDFTPFFIFSDRFPKSKILGSFVLLHFTPWYDLLSSRKQSSSFIFTNV